MAPAASMTQHALQYRPDGSLPFILTLSLGPAGSAAEAFVCAFSLPDALTNDQLMKLVEGLSRVLRPVLFACADQAFGRMTLQIGEYFREESYHTPPSTMLTVPLKIRLLQQAMLTMVNDACMFRDEAGDWYPPEAIG